jgi:multidrug efflux pump subunit AcrA (membrane-fusion protein)
MQTIIRFFLIAFMPLIVSAKVHYATVEPIEQATIKSSVSGVVLQANRQAEGTVLGSEPFVQIDDTLDRASLHETNESLKLLRESLAINQQMLAGLKSTYMRRQSAYERLKDLSSASQTQKDNSYAATVAAQNQYLAARDKIISLKKQILDLTYKKTLLEDTIAKKRFAYPGRYLYRLSVRTGEFVSPGMPVAIVQDLTRAQMIVYLDRDELVDGEGKKIEAKTIYVDGKPTQLHIDRLWKVADSEYISSYRARIVTLPTYPFSKLVKIEFK